jgi:16S rRNA (guanine527-N7)-methyltransferase
MEEDIRRYFPDLTADQADKLSGLEEIYSRWNRMINVISRKDMEDFTVHHLLHSLSIGRVFQFTKGVKVLDVGTGGGFPGIPLAIVFTDAEFSLLDSTGKKIKVVSAVADQLGLTNVIPLNKRVEDEKGIYDYVTGRAVTDFQSFVKLTKKNVKSSFNKPDQGGIICLKGGDLSAELGNYRTRVRIWNISDFFEEPFFKTKKIVYLPVQNINNK